MNKLFRYYLIALCLFCCLQQKRLSAQVIIQPELSHKNVTPNFFIEKAYINIKLARARKIIFSDFDSAVILYKEGLLDSRRIGYKQGIQNTLIGLGVMYMEQGEISMGKKFLETVLNQSRHELSPRYLTATFINLSRAYSYEGDFLKAYHYLDSVLITLQTNVYSGDTFSLGMVFNNIASIFITIAEPDKALHYLTLSREIAREIKDTNLLLLTSNNLAYVYKNKGARDNALTVVNRAIALGMASENMMGLLTSYEIKANLLGSMGATDSAIALLKKAEKLSLQYNPKNSTQNASISLALSEHLIKKKAFAEAKKYMDYYEDIFSGLPSNSLKHRSYNALASLNFGLHNYKDAYVYLLQSYELYDSILKQDKPKAINELETKYRTSEKDNQLIRQRLLLAQKEKSLQQKNFWIGSILIGSILMATFIYFLFRHKQRLQEAKVINMEKDREISHFKAVLQGEEKERSRIAHELHDGIISQLTSVKLRFSTLLQQEKPIDRDIFNQGFQYLDETMQDLRKTAHNLMPEAVMKSGLTGALNDFCRKMDNENATRIHFMTNGYYPLDKVLELSLYRIVQELVQNALKYAHAHRLLVQLNYHETLLNITVEDDGTGFDPLLPTSGTGLSNIKERVQIMEGFIELRSEPGNGTTIYLEIPIFTHSNIINHVSYKSNDHR